MRETASVYKAELHWSSIVDHIDDEHKEQAKEIEDLIMALRSDMEPDSYFGEGQ